MPNWRVETIKGRFTFKSKGLGGIGQRELHESKQGQMRSPSSGQEKALAVVQAGNRLSVEQLCRKGPVKLDWQQAEHDPAACPGCKDCQLPWTLLGLELLPCKESLKGQDLFSLEKRQFQGDLTKTIHTYSQVIEMVELGSSQQCMIGQQEAMGLRLKKEVQTGYKEKLFPKKNMLPSKIVQSSCL